MVISGFLIKYFGRAGSLIIALGLGILSSFVATEFMILPILKWLGRRLVQALLNLKKLRYLFTKKTPRPKGKATPVLTPLRNKVGGTLKAERLPIKIEKFRLEEQPPRKEKLKLNIVKQETPKTPVKTPATKEKEGFADYKLPTLDLFSQSCTTKYHINVAQNIVSFSFSLSEHC